MQLLYTAYIPGSPAGGERTTSVAATSRTVSDSRTTIRDAQTANVDDGDVTPQAVHSAPAVPRPGDADDRRRSPTLSMKFTRQQKRSYMHSAWSLPPLRHTSTTRVYCKFLHKQAAEVRDYGLEACPLRKSQFSCVNFVINSTFIKKKFLILGRGMSWTSCLTVYRRNRLLRRIRLNF